ncbi:hypothetical protein VQ643_04740 [Pseudomonas sp. F1_0610]|uniref:hypothetical protein n=1 Tax=Pseudomonas sp. F1_0610 TaxID=3114284 RepID=UPI0039C078CA
MKLNKIQLAIRPRQPLEAVDLGINLAQHYRRPLTLIWLGISFPVFLVIMLLFSWSNPLLGLTIFWLVKPLLGRALLHYLSLAIFAEKPNIKETIKLAPRLMKKEWLACMTWQRLFCNRSFTLPVLQLEQLTGKNQATRLKVLSFQNKTAPNLLTCCLGLIELILLAGFFSLLFQLAGSADILSNFINNYLGVDNTKVYQGLSIIFYYIIVAFIEPIYIACGFTLYLNQRSNLEAWDIEISFKQLAQRISKTLGCFLFIVFMGVTTADNSFATSSSVEELPVEQPRMLKQMLTTEDSQQKIKEIKNNPPFKNITTVREYKNNGNFSFLSAIPNVFIWLFIALIVIFILWYYRDSIQRFSLKAPSFDQPPKAITRPQQILGLDMSTDNLPKDIIEQARQLWAQSPRQALSLLYRGFLLRLLDEHRLPLKSSNTEMEILRLVPFGNQALYTFSKKITNQWIDVAWGHKQPDQQVFNELCARWNDTKNVQVMSNE